MKDLTHYFQSPANFANKTASSSNESIKVLNESQETTESNGSNTNIRSSEVSASKERKTLSLKHMHTSKNVKKKEKTDSEDIITKKLDSLGSPSDKNETPSSNVHPTDSPNHTKKHRGQPKKLSLTSMKPASETKRKSEQSNDLTPKGNPEKDSFVSLIDELSSPKTQMEEETVSQVTNCTQEVVCKAEDPDDELLVKTLDNTAEALEMIDEALCELSGKKRGKPANSVHSNTLVSMLKPNVEIKKKLGRNDLEKTKTQEKYTEEHTKRKYTKKIKSADKKMQKDTPQECKDRSRNKPEPRSEMDQNVFDKRKKELNSESEEEKMSKKFRLEKEEISKVPSVNITKSKSNVSNAFQLMMSCGSKKSTISTNQDKIETYDGRNLQSALNHSDPTSKEKRDLSSKHSQKEGGICKKTKEPSPPVKKACIEPNPKTSSVGDEVSYHLEKEQKYKSKNSHLKKTCSNSSVEEVLPNSQSMKEGNENVKKAKMEKNVSKNVTLVQCNTKFTLTVTDKTEKSPDAFKFLMSSNKNLKPHEKTDEDMEEEEAKKVRCSKGKRKRIIVSENDDSDEKESPTPSESSKKVNKPSGLYGYFSPVSREEALKKISDAPITKTIAADVHQAPSSSSPEEGRRHSLGPKRRSQRLPCKGDEEKIIVVSVEEPSEKLCVPENPFNFKTPEKKRKKKRRAWQLKIKLLSPAKPLEELTDSSSCSESDSDYLEIMEIKGSKQNDIKALWASKGKLAPIFLPKNKNASSQSNTAVFAKVIRKIVPSVAMPLMRAAPTEHFVGFAEVDPGTPMSVLFPSISHITQSEKTVGDDKSSSSLPPLRPPEQDTTFSSIPINFLLTPSEPCFLSPLSLPAPAAVRRASEKSGESWCDKHRPNCAAMVAGNSRSVQRLRDWLEGWRQRSGAQEERSQHSSDSESSESSSGDDFVSSDDESSTNGRTRVKRKKHCNTALLVGPCGSGKTTAVYAAADELGFKVLEMNASSRRSGKRILSELQEATQSHQVRNATDQETLNTFFSGPNKAKDSAKEAVESQQSGGSAGLSLILVEDVDVVFEEQDEGFLAALNVLAASSKRPLVLVSNEPRCPLLLARQHRLHLEFSKVPSTLIGPVVQRICKTEGQMVNEAQLGELLRMCSGDLRQAVLLAQTWTLSGGFPQQTSSQLLPFPLDLSTLWLGLSHTPLPYIITDSELLEEESSDVEQSHQEDSSDSEHIFSPPTKQKQKIQRRRLTSDSSWETLVPQKQATPCSNLRKAWWLADVLATLDVLQGQGPPEWCSFPRPGLSDQPCIDEASDPLGNTLRHWLASKAVMASGCTLALRTSEENDRWRGTHCQVDEALLGQLPLTSQLDRRSAATDLLSAMRGLGCLEQASARASRRSKINPLHSLGFTLDALTLDILPLIFLKTSEDL